MIKAASRTWRMYWAQPSIRKSSPIDATVMAVPTTASADMDLEVEGGASSGVFMV